MIIVLLTILGSTIPLYIHTDNKMEKMRTETREEILALTTETREEILAMTTEIREEIKQQSARTDRLYEMFIKLVEKRDG